MVAGADENEDVPVADAVSGSDGERVYLYTGLNTWRPLDNAEFGPEPPPW